MSIYYTSYNSISFPADDPTLTTENVASVMEKVTVTERTDVWKLVLGGAAKSYVESVHRNNLTKEERTFVCSDRYIHHFPESSWENLTSVLYGKDEMTAVDLARPFLPPRGKLGIVKINVD